jgi:hypothetical protein
LDTKKLKSRKITQIFREYPPIWRFVSRVYSGLFGIFAKWLSHFGVSNVRKTRLCRRLLEGLPSLSDVSLPTAASKTRGRNDQVTSETGGVTFERGSGGVDDGHVASQRRALLRSCLSLSDSDNMSAEPEILNRKSVIARGSSLLLDRGRTDRLFRSRLESSRGKAAIASALNDNERMQAPSGNHSNGSGLIENGIDLMCCSELEIENSHLPVWNANQPSELVRSADDH